MPGLRVPPRPVVPTRPFPHSIAAAQDTSNAAIMKAIAELKANQMTLHKLLNTVIATQGTIVTLVVSLMQATAAVNGSQSPGLSSLQRALQEMKQKADDSYAALLAATTV